MIIEGVQVVRIGDLQQPEGRRREAAAYLAIAVEEEDVAAIQRGGEGIGLGLGGLAVRLAAHGGAWEAVTPRRH